jgi:hypothetical protein
VATGTGGCPFHPPRPEDFVLKGGTNVEKKTGPPTLKKPDFLTYARMKVEMAMAEFRESHAQLEANAIRAIAAGQKNVIMPMLTEAQVNKFYVKTVRELAKELSTEFKRFNDFFSDELDVKEGRWPYKWMTNDKKINAMLRRTHDLPPEN